MSNPDMEPAGLKVRVGRVFVVDGYKYEWFFGTVKGAWTADGNTIVKVLFDDKDKHECTFTEFVTSFWRLGYPQDRPLAHDTSEIKLKTQLTWIGMQVKQPYWEAKPGSKVWEGVISGVAETEDGLPAFEVMNIYDNSDKPVISTQDFLNHFRFVKGA
ncbi:hypothetical protein N9E76_00550 [bacterium]|nr:hypothetical protein [bacterium]